MPKPPGCPARPLPISPVATWLPGTVAAVTVLGTDPTLEPLKPPNCWVLVAPKVLAPPVLKRLTPRALSFDRSTWANLTFNKICFCRPGCAIRSESTISLEKDAAIFAIWSATGRLDAVPLKTIRFSSDSA